MKKGTRILLILLIVLLTILLGTLGVVLATQSVFVGGSLYPRYAQTLDLRGKNITPEKFDKIAAALPDCSIRWDIPLSNGSLDSHTAKLTVAELTDSDVDALRYAPRLKLVDGTRCKNYAQLARLQAEKPDCEVLYSISICGKKYDQDATSVDAPTLNDETVALMQCLPKLKSVNATGCTDTDYISKVQSEHPEWEISYTVTIRNVPFDGSMTEAALPNATADEISALLKGLRKLKRLDLSFPSASPEELLSFREQYPNVEIHWIIDLGGMSVDDTATDVDASGVTLNSIDDAKTIVAYFPNAQQIYFGDQPAVDNEDFAALRDELRSHCKVVWMVHMGPKSKARTDATWFHPISENLPYQEREYYFQDSYTPNMKYLEDVIAVDVGDQPNVKNCEWAAYMPKLKYLILAHTNVQDISPLSNCKELVFLELDSTAVRDYSPLVECTKLEDLNLGETHMNHEPIKKMTWLKHLWWKDKSAAAIAELKQCLPDCEIQYRMDATVANGWRRLPNYYAMRDALHAKYMTW